MPSSINYRANIWALKEEGCTHIIATTACGSLQEEYAPGDIVFLDQFIDRLVKVDCHLLIVHVISFAGFLAPQGVIRPFMMVNQAAPLESVMCSLLNPSVSIFDP